MPSPACETSRVANNRRKSRPASTPRKSAQTADLDPLATPSSLGGAASGRYRATSPWMNCSTRSRQTSSPYCSGGDFMKYELAEITGPPMPRSRAILAARTASMMTPAELGEAHASRSEEHTSELQSHVHLVCRLL